MSETIFTIMFYYPEGMVAVLQEDLTRLQMLEPTVGCCQVRLKQVQAKTEKQLEIIVNNWFLF